MDQVLAGMRIHINGVVQGVGFRPFVYGLAARLSLNGWVRNTSAGVDIEVDGPPHVLAEFAHLLTEEAPPLARIDEVITEDLSTNGFTHFKIIHSQAIPEGFQPISPDVSICSDCLREMFDPADRRYRYPFTNCTNCGPRFTIIEDIPYDRPNTSMAGFKLCPACQEEYENPLDRRFHAQPVACPECGPQVWLETGGEIMARGEAAMQETNRLLALGKIVAIKGLGGFHLACNALDPEAVAGLRRRKLRVDKPFALMAANLEAVEEHCRVSSAERELLESIQRPVVILDRRLGSPVAAEVAPHQNSLGIMLPYTPLHYLLFAADAPGEPAPLLVMTSGNLSEEPIAIDNDEARHRLSSLADAFLMHDRPIRTRCDDAVMRVAKRETGEPRAEYSQARLPREFPVPLRRSRGYAPFPVRLPFESTPLLAVGAELKNTFCITRERYAFLSHHIGDLENYETLRSFEDGVAHFERLFRVHPEALVYDLHPNYLATRYALERANRENLPAIGVQHHHAHFAACLAENGCPDEHPVIGVIFDGTGFGPDGAIWGGEILLGSYRTYQRVYHLAYTPLPGGDAAIRKPARAALAHLWQAGLPWEPGLPCTSTLNSGELAVLRTQLERQVNSPLTSSMGRLFDAAAALVGVRQSVNYEAQAAIELEALADPNEPGAYIFEVPPPSEQPVPIGLYTLWEAMLQDRRAGETSPKMAARFHNGVAGLVSDACRALRSTAGVNEVALSGGVWQNMTLLRKTLSLLEQAGFRVYVHQLAPANDGGLALGQAAVAAAQMKSGHQPE